MDEITRQFRVLGKVQGVYFRHSTRQEARKLALRGVARNMPDGSVEVVVHGEPSAVETLKQWLHRGPTLARVKEVREINPADAPVLPDGFEVF